MAWSFNVFTGNLDQTGSGAVVFEGEVETFADLPETVGDPAVGASFLVRSSTGVWLVNRRQAGIWIRKNNTGVRATDWEYGGDYPVNSVAGKTGNVTLTNSDISGLGSAATANLNAISDADLRIVGSTDATKKVAIEVDSLVSAGTTRTITVPNKNVTLDDASDARTPSSHASTHHTSGTDAIAPNNISAAWAQVVSSQSITGNTVLSSGRNRRITLLAVGVTANVDLPFSGNQNGDILTLDASFTFTCALTIRRAVAMSGGSPVAYATIGTLTANGQALTVVSNGTATGWSLVAVDTHTHAAADVTSGVLDNARINFAAPSAIGSTTPAAVSATDLSASNRLNIPNTNGTTAGDVYRNANTLRYRDSTNTERLLLNASDNLANLASASTARTNLGVGSSDAVTFGSIQNTPIGSTTPAAITGTTGTFSTLNATNGTITASAPVLDLSQTWNNAAVTFTGLRFNATNTASGGSSLLLDLQTGGSSQFSVRRDGVANAGLGFTCGTNTSVNSTQGIKLRGDFSIEWSSTGFTFDSSRLIVVRDADDVLAVRRTTNPQTFRLYNTFTDASNYERGFLRWSSNVLQIGTEAGGTGSGARAIMFVTNGTNRWTIGGGGGSLVAQGAFPMETTGYIRAGDGATAGYQIGNSSFVRLLSSSAGILLLTQAEGTSDFGRLQFGGTTNAFPALKRSSTTLQVRLADDSAFAPFQCSTLLGSDNGTVATLGGSGEFRLTSTGQLAFASRGAILMSADGVMRLTNNAGTDFGRLAFGGTSASFPALKRSSTVLQSRLADDSDFAPLQGQLRIHQNAVSETITATHTLTLYDAAGTAYKVPCVAA